MLAFVPWDVSPIIAHLGPLTLRWYGVLFALGFVFGSFILTHIYKAERVSERWVDVITIYMIAGTVLGARLGHVLFYSPEYYLTSEHFLEIFKIWEGGLASHGATLGILLAVWLFSRRNKFDYLWVLDRIVIVVAVGGACIRLGNLMNSEIVGRPTDVPWAFVFPRDTEHLQRVEAGQTVPAGSLLVRRTQNPDNTVSIETSPADATVAAPSEVAVPRHPTQIYESLFCVFLFVLLYGLWSKYKDQTPRGLLFGLFVVLLFSFRFLVEFLKEEQVSFEKGMTLNMGQLLSLPLILVGLWVLLRAGKDPNNRHGYAVRE
ncbi:prolipoprotein diacylglyceryl transferase [Hymenobacter sp. BT18]|uniref:prolipoprotein diacylglyceryl transferase n=1 Tax=Hymenobacter sp. BT18 TaxID=2835648 RepID=UPI00143E49AA|nr:prolipoprotein diacylglyceryl transferase [Hymenobacter sp. BT18]QIX62441.1 prolipoprotein diacylglyceryl transferase [Hymenobacter sp. BT18]